jgi:histidinol-phosphate aminotransferase
LAIPVAEPYDRPPGPPANARAFFLANPNSPVGFMYPLSLVRDLARKVRGIFVVDEAYVEFAKENALGLVLEMENVIVVRTVSKSYSLAGVRLGYAIGREDLIQEVFKVKDPFNVNRLTQAVVAAALEDQEYFRKNISRVVETREWFCREARALGYRIIPSQGNFVFPQPPEKGRGIKFFQTLYDRKILTRYYDEERLRDGVRMTIGTRGDMETTLQVMKDILKVL